MRIMKSSDSEFELATARELGYALILANKIRLATSRRAKQDHSSLEVSRAVKEVIEKIVREAEEKYH